MPRICVPLLLIGVVGFTWAEPKGDCDIKKLDACAADLFIFASSEKIPESPEALEPYCKKQEQTLTCANDYIKRCTDSITQGIARIFLDDIKSEVEKRCDTSTTYSQEFLKYAPCLNKAGSGLHKCFRGVTADFDQAARLPDKQRIGGACCKFNVFEQCVHNAVQSQCDEQTVEFTKTIVAKYAGELLGTVCTAFRSGDKCKNIQFGSTPGDKNIKAPLTPLIKVAAALG